MTGNEKLHKANREKNDEFYTQLSDIEKELSHYREYFKGKTIFCNCDDPEWSNFWKYFELKFDKLGVKKVISTHFDKVKPTYKLELIGDITGDGITNNMDIIKTGLKQNGDFRSPECVELLKEADIVITNPPFSLFREYVAQLVEYDKKFLIIGNKNTITYKEIFKLIKENKLWLGYTPKVKRFRVPDSYEGKLISKEDDGFKYANNVGNVTWFTNIETTLRHEKLDLYKKYTPEEYPHYDNYDAINVNKTCDIPEDYDGVMGVPITFLDKYNPEQFEIIALGNSRDNFTPSKDYINPQKHTKDGKIINGGAINCVLAIETVNIPINQVYYTSDNSKYLVPPYARILIKKRGN